MFVEDSPPFALAARSPNLTQTRPVCDQARNMVSDTISLVFFIFLKFLHQGLLVSSCQCYLYVFVRLYHIQNALLPKERSHLCLECQPSLLSILSWPKQPIANCRFIALLNNSNRACLESCCLVLLLFAVGCCSWCMDVRESDCVTCCTGSVVRWVSLLGPVPGRVPFPSHPCLLHVWRLLRVRRPSKQHVSSQTLLPLPVFVAGP